MWAKEAFRGLKGNWIFSFLVILQISISLILVNVLVQNVKNMNASAGKYEKLWHGDTFYTLSDQLQGDEERIFFQGNNGLIRLKAYIQELEENKEYTYYIHGKHPTSIGDTEVEAKQIGEKLMADFPIAVVQGRAFASEDYIYAGDVVPVLIGHALSGTFSVGQTFSGSNYGLPMLFQVVGIAQEDSYFPINEWVEYLDHHIIMPALKFANLPQDDMEDALQKRIYLQYANGTFRVSGEDRLGPLSLYLDEIRNKYGIFEMKYLGISPAKISLLLFSSQEQLQLINLLTVLVCLFACVSLGVMIDVSVRSSSHRYAILVINGASFRQLVSYVLGEGIFALIIAAAVAFSMLLWFFAETVSFDPSIFAIALALCLFCSLPGLYRLAYVQLPGMTKEVA